MQVQSKTNAGCEIDGMNFKLDEAHRNWSVPLSGSTAVGSGTCAYVSVALGALSSKLWNAGPAK